ncbi:MULTISPECIES: bifunctional UDP-sugar hydrolase/5'-nucleotidase [Corynebacterium]|uniref:Bifunctional metallophosphatase/5'-nucleotidase n=1 Tax=Corynebacterium aurimucosum TaxID=169292 RepID=A0A558IV23_9CORY|nr:MULTISPECIES: bifunctional UDP-sugar hydrolase/5'-nucleotidase [Corynebacterium]OFK65079.1 bifunctional metallophosphatase/5'-nucleotidase [Corynebacterium sp. HMSC074A09]OFK68465.1 bifunctional metallophosphatase/5'-nucleotidase [Corynebacterium sp. HMSC076G08]OFN36132.1 bifunctional metallophosphatase/5'-nucleotidase [Corynebacterium sp. HMSC072A04]OFP31701.1 bifunctional metallophosphatase/5'-nucleotidase [Corynebacterium sp. HMSC068G04]TVU85245.1 bifunctional metallophosphatase/5'-nucle
MNFRRFGQLLAATTVTAVAVSGAPAFAAEADQVTISVTNFTDFHGHLELAENFDKETEELVGYSEMGAARMAALIKAVNKDQEYALTSSGDNVGGSAFVSAISEDKYTNEALNAMNLDVTAVGNHEFDKGDKDLMGRIKDQSNFPILGANVTKDGKPLLDASFVKEVDGVKVGFVGTVTENTKYKVSAASIPGVEFSDPVEATNKEASRLKESGEAEVVVALMHEDAQQFAEGFNKDVDILFGGDTHVKTQGEVAREGALPLYWAQGYEYGKVLNDADITFDKAEKKITKIDLKQYDVADAEVFAQLQGLEDDPEVAKVVEEAKKVAEIEGAKTAGTTEKAMYRGSDEGKDTGSNRGVESTLNNFIAEGQRYALAKPAGKDIEIGVMNAGGVRADLKEGDVTYQDIFAVQPFGNSVITAEVSGADFITALENQWKPGQSRPRLALGLSNNVTVVYDQKAEQGKRVKSVTINGEPIDPNKNYSIALSSFLASSDTEAGGDGFFEPGSIKNRNDVGHMDTQAMIDYIASGESKVRTGQGQIGAHIEGDLKPGSEITIDLSSLNYSNAEEPQAKKVTVALGDAKAEAGIDNAAQPGDEQFGERGRATVKLTIPEGLEGEQKLSITTDAGTKAVLPITLEGAGNDEDPKDPENPKDPKDNGSNKDVASSVGLGVGITVAIAAAIAAVIGAINLPAGALPAPVQQMIEQLRKQFNI